MVGVHAEGEVGDVIVGGVLDVPGSTMYDKMLYMWDENDSIRQLLLNEPRGPAPICTSFILPSCNPKADAGLIIMEVEEYGPMSGSNVICMITVLLKTGMIKMKKPVTVISLDMAASRVFKWQVHKFRIRKCAIVCIWSGYTNRYLRPRECQS